MGFRSITGLSASPWHLLNFQFVVNLRCLLQADEILDSTLRCSYG
jgi:hypothetical protein